LSAMGKSPLWIGQFSRSCSCYAVLVSSRAKFSHFAAAIGQRRDRRS
jgi:hypothetical protein